MEFRSSQPDFDAIESKSAQTNTMHIPDSPKPRIVIIGGGFAGIEFIKALGKHSPYQIVLFDKHNYHTFQPLLYQVATAGLGPDSIAAPLRKVFTHYEDFYYRMAEVNKILPDEKCIHTSIGNLHYDHLILATGSMTNFYGMEDIKENALAMKMLPQAINIRSKILENYEKALLTSNLGELNSLMDVVIVGGGPTGVELAGAMAELRKGVLPKDLPELDFSKMDIYLLEAGNRLLMGMSDNAHEKAAKYLKELGVVVKFGAAVKSYDGFKVNLGDGTEILAQTVIWAAGVKGNIIEGLNKETIIGGRYKVNQFNQIEGFSNIYAVGDVGVMIDDERPRGHPMVAQVAIQQGKNLAKNFLRMKESKALVPFKYKDKGSMATIGRNKAVVDLPNFRFNGVFAWFVWMFVHLLFLIGFKNKVTTFISWVWNYFTFDRSTRLIIRPSKKKAEELEEKRI
jgi:NADH dehydrogenase